MRPTPARAAGGRRGPDPSKRAPRVSVGLPHSLSGSALGMGPSFGCGSREGVRLTKAAVSEVGV